MAIPRRAGVSEPLSEGERLEKARRMRKAWIIGGTFAMGLGAGFAVGVREAENLFGAEAGWPPAMAIAIALSYVVAAIGGGFLLARQTDEVELIGQYKAAAIGALVYILSYPVWFALWMGDLVREPMHGVLFAAFWASTMLSFLYYRFR